MKRALFLLCFIFLGTLLCPAQTGAPEERYGPVFYGIPLPDTGARILLVIDTSKSMGRKDKTRADEGTRWDTLCDEVRSMTDTMKELIQERRVNFTVTLLYEGGKSPHEGSSPYDIATPGTDECLLTDLSTKTFTSGGSFETTFNETLWPLVAKQHITHIFYLGDNDIGKYDDAVRNAVAAWYTLPRKAPTQDQRKLWTLKNQWWEPWKHWRKPAGSGKLVFKKQQSLPPPPRDVTFSCIAIGQASPLLKELATRGNGIYVERLSKKKRKAKKQP